MISYHIKVRYSTCFCKKLSQRYSFYCKKICELNKMQKHKNANLTKGYIGTNIKLFKITKLLIHTHKPIIPIIITNSAR